MRTAAYKVDVAMRPPQARVSQAKLYFILQNFKKVQGSQRFGTPQKLIRDVVNLKKITSPIRLTN